MAQYPKGTYLEYRDEKYYMLNHIYDVYGDTMFFEVLKSNHPAFIVGRRGRRNGWAGWTDITKEYKVLEILRKWRENKIISNERERI